MLDLDTPYSRAAPFNPNQCPIELEDQSINAIITERNHQLNTVLHEISDLETIMNGIQNLHQQLVEKKNKIIESINSHKRLKLALWRLPTEILSYIFVYCLPEDRYLSPASRRAPILLTRICRRWREVAVGMPSLWCRLRVAVEHSDWQKQAFCYDVWLKRTLGHPLSLALRCYNNWTPLVRSLLHPYIHQISSLKIDFEQVEQPECVFKDFSALQELIIPNHITFKLLCSFAPLWAHLTKVELLVDKPDAFMSQPLFIKELRELLPKEVLEAIHAPQASISASLWRSLEFQRTITGHVRCSLTPQFMRTSCLEYINLAS